MAFSHHNHFVSRLRFGACGESRRDRSGASALGRVRGRADSGVLAGELRQPRAPRLAGDARRGRPGGVESQPVSRRTRRVLRRGLIVVEHAGAGRGNSPVVAVTSRRQGPGSTRTWTPRCSRWRCRGAGAGVRGLLLAALAALADEQLAVEPSVHRGAAGGRGDGRQHVPPSEGGVAGERRSRARGRRWRSGEDEPLGASRPALGQLRAGAGAARPGRAEQDGEAAARHRHRADAADRREPAVAPAAIANGPGSSGVSGANPAENQTISAGNSPGLSGVSVRNPAQCRTVWRQTPPETPPETPPQTPPLYVRAGREPRNPRTFPPQPPDGGSSCGQVSIVEDYITDRGRNRQRTVVVELDAIREQLRAASDGDLADWERIRSELRVLVGESTFEIWLAQLELAATDPGGRLVSLPCVHPELGR